MITYFEVANECLIFLRPCISEHTSKALPCVACEAMMSIPPQMDLSTCYEDMDSNSESRSSVSL